MKRESSKRAERTRRIFYKKKIEESERYKEDASRLVKITYKEEAQKTLNRFLKKFRYFVCV